MITDRLQKAINDQITAEMWSSQLYLQMSYFLKSQGWDGFGHWMALQAAEERGHATSMADYMTERGGVVKLYSDSASFESILGYFEIENDGGITDILIADESKNNSDPRPLIVIYCNSKETTENVYTSARKSLSKISEFIGFGSIEKCKTLKADNTVLIGHAEMIELAKGGI